MTDRKYHEFDLVIEPAGQGYCARVLGSPSGQASIEFKLPFSSLEIENFVLRLGRSRGAARRVESSEMAAAKSFGGALFGAVFAGDVRSCLRASSDEASRQGVGLRMRLHLSRTPELADLPWEYLYDAALNRFLGLSAETPIVRYLDLPERVRPLAVKPPLRILVVIASPQDFPQLDVEREYENLRRALEPLVARGLLALDRLSEPTLAGLQSRLRQSEYHVFHFIGHGGFDRQAEDGVLVFEDEDGRSRQVGAQYLGTLLHDHRSLRLAVLNACEGARGARDDPFSGTAQGLVQQGVPAVIAMQFEVSDKAAVTFSQELYSAVAVGYPVDAALAEARKAIFAQVNELEWGTPVLYMRAPDGRIFDVQEVGELERQASVKAVQREAQEPVRLSPAPPVPVTRPAPPIAAPPVVQTGFRAPPVAALAPAGTAPVPPPPKRTASRTLWMVALTLMSVFLGLRLLSQLGSQGVESQGVESQVASPPAAADSSGPGAVPSSSSPDSELALKESLASALSKARSVESEAFRTHDKSLLATVLTGRELGDNEAAIDSLEAQGLYLATKGRGEEIESFTMSPDGDRAEVRVHETSEGALLLSRETDQCVAQIPRVEGSSTIVLERQEDGWLISSAQNHYALPAPISCEGTAEEMKRRNIERSFKHMD